MNPRRFRLPSRSLPTASTIAALAVILTAVSAVGRAAEPLLSRADETFLADQARRLVKSARLAPGETAGQWKNNTPYALHVPGGNMGYPAFWVRDAVMMLGGDLVPAAEVEGWIRLMARTAQGPKPWRVRPGAVVPAFAVPDHISFEGEPTFYPGTLNTNSEQGGHPFGKYPPLDDHFYFLLAVYHHWRLTGDTSLFLGEVETASVRRPLADLCERVYNVAPVDRKTGLVVAGDVDTENAKDFGFCDTIFKSGKLLFTSTLKFLAARSMAELFEAANQPAKAERYRRDATQIQKAIPEAFFEGAPEGEQGEEGWLLSATEVGRQRDVWGSAFAVWSGAVEGEVAVKVGRALTRAFRQRTAVQNGFVRHLPVNDPVNGGFWEKAISKPQEYQNGGYWGAPVGWYLAAVHKADPEAARMMAKEYIQFLRDNRRPDGVSEAWEWIHPDTGKRVNPLYVATVALPYLSLKEAGLLAEESR